MKTNIVFLDLDGVLNNRVSQFLSSKHPGDEKRLQLFSRDCTDLLKVLLISTNSKFVITSSWRKFGCLSIFHKDNWHIGNAFELAGFVDWKDYVFESGVTPHTNLLRGNDIQRFMNEHYMAQPQLMEPPHTINPFGVNSYVILDDDSDMLPHQMSNFVQTEESVGLRITDIMAAARVLGSEISWNTPLSTVSPTCL